MMPLLDRPRSEYRALTWAALIAAAVIGYLAAPVAVGILLGTLLAFIAQPLHERLQRHLWRKASALVTVWVATAVVLGSVVGLFWMLAVKGTAHMGELIAALGPDAPGGGALAALGRLASRLGFEPTEVPMRVRALADGAATRFAGYASAVLSVTASTLLALFFMMLAMHFVLRNTHAVLRLAVETLPLKPEWTHALFLEFRRVGKTTLFGTVATGFAQGLLATLGYWIFGVPDPLFYGALTAVASLVPGVGTLLVWVPAGVVMIATGRPIGGVFELIWGAAMVVGVSDYVIRPRLVGHENQLPSLVTFTALFGGVGAFGLEGLIVGPVLMSLGIAVLRLYSREFQERRAVGQPMVRLAPAATPPRPPPLATHRG
jgi:predicted PurR-regulated permease PerM